MRAARNIWPTSGPGGLVRAEERLEGCRERVSKRGKERDTDNMAVETWDNEVYLIVRAICWVWFFLAV